MLWEQGVGGSNPPGSTT